MTRLTPLWSQPGAYPASTDRQLIRAIWPGGGMRGMAPAVVSESMQIQLAAGSVVVPAPDGGSWLCASDAPERVAIDAAPPSGQDRIDLVTIAVDDTAPGWTPQAQAGNPSANPAPPAPAPGTVAICSVRVRGGSAVLNPSDLVDQRFVGESVQVVTPPNLSNPGLTIEGTEVDCVVNDAPILVWRLRYRSTITDPHKWMFVGGSPLETYTTGSGTAGDNVFSGGQNPMITVPCPGLYRLEQKVDGQNFTSLPGVLTLTADLASAPNTTSAYAAASAAQTALAPGMTGPAVNAGTTPLLAAGESIRTALHGSIGNMAAINRMMRLTPIRVS